MIHDLYLRAHIVVSGEASEEADKSPKGSHSRKLWPDYALVLDTETTLDLEQRLNFGIWRFCRLQGTEYVAVQEGIFHRDGLDTTNVQTILAYKRKHLADGIVKGADQELTVLSRAGFIERIFWESVRAGALIVGFNLSFDISRIRVDWTAARNGGFSFVLSQLSKSHVNNIHRPRIRIAPLNGVAELIELTAVRRENEQHRWRRGRFLDLHTLAFALTDNSYSLAGAIKAFGSQPEKMEYEPTGHINEKEITYARQDVRATLGLLNALKREYELHPIALLPDRAYSPASIGKAYLRAMGITEPMRKFKSPGEDSRNRDGRLFWRAGRVSYPALAGPCRAGRPDKRVPECRCAAGHLGCTDGRAANISGRHEGGPAPAGKCHFGCLVPARLLEAAQLLCANLARG